LREAGEKMKRLFQGFIVKRIKLFSVRFSIRKIFTNNIKYYIENEYCPKLSAQPK